MVLPVDFEPVPVTVLSGFLGSGKTTLLKNILEQAHLGKNADKKKYKVAVLVNDMADVNIDANLVRDTRQLVQSEAKMVELHNGCICCTLREDLIKELADLAAQRKFDAIVVESTGVSDPMEVAETFAVDVVPPGYQQHQVEEVAGEGGAEGEAPAADEGMAPKNWEMDSIVKALRGKSSLNELARLDTCVTMVDCSNFRSNLSTAAELQERFRDEGGAEEGDNRNVAPLLMSQIEFADVIGLSKCDLVSEEEVKSVLGSLKALNPDAKVLRVNKGDMPMASIVDTKMFSMEKAAMAPGWLKGMRDEEVVPETEVYGIDSFVYRQRAPFHPLRLMRFLTQHFIVKMVSYSDDELESEDEEEDDNENGNNGDAMGIEAATVAGEVKISAEAIGVPSAAQQQGSRKRPMTEKEQFEWNNREEECTRRQKRLRESFGNVLRSKGYMWIAGRDQFVGEWSQAGAVGDISCGGYWYCTAPKEEWPEEGTEPYEMLMADFAGEEIGDRRQEIVFIGQNISKDKLTAALDACLLKREDVRLRGRSSGSEEHGWKFGVDYLKDEFPSWDN